MTRLSKKDVYRKVAAAGLPPIAKQAELLGKVFAILELKLETYEEEGGEARDYYIGKIRLDGKEGLFYLSGVAVMPKLEVLADIEGGLPSDWTLIKKKSKGGSRYDIQEPAAPAAGELFDAEQGAGA